ncbi:hypothetical protein [Nannocystis pusilla]|uniref:Fibronectin type-III domain-containing protein n=1 Tax=Nannocystis pusilla TaxID=889268 RepID=A0ABS7TUF3_9BACT|nr:hypothetical protein [Nannocystis pusilla]MBZ5711767.1 hypothetical protein [Nannocystis pusilla]
MRHRPSTPIAMIFTVLLAACGADHKSTDAATHAGTHGGGDTADTTTATTGESTTPTTAAAVMAGTRHVYRVKAVNAGGEGVSAELTVQVP